VLILETLELLEQKWLSCDEYPWPQSPRMAALRSGYVAGLYAAAAAIATEGARTKEISEAAFRIEKMP